MPAFLADYPYLGATLLTLLPVLAALVLAPRMRPGLLAAGAIETLHAPFCAMFQEVYWTPRRLWDLPFGVEDVLICFALGGGVWLAASLPFPGRISRPQGSPGWPKRLLAALVLPVTPAVALRLIGYGLMESLILATLATAAALALLRPGLRPLAGAALVLFVPVYAALLAVEVWLIPELAAIWTGPELWGTRLLQVPLDELAWAVSFAAGYPLVLGYVLDVRLQPRATRT